MLVLLAAAGCRSGASWNDPFGGADRVPPPASRIGGDPIPTLPPGTPVQSAPTWSGAPPANAWPSTTAPVTAVAELANHSERAGRFDLAVDDNQQLARRADRVAGCGASLSADAGTNARRFAAGAGWLSANTFNLRTGAELLLTAGQLRCVAAAAGDSARRAARILSTVDWHELTVDRSIGARSAEHQLRVLRRACGCRNRTASPRKVTPPRPRFNR